MNWSNNVVDSNGMITHYNPNNHGWYLQDGQSAYFPTGTPEQQYIDYQL